MTSGPAASRPGWRVWWMAIRPATLPVSAVPVLVGSAVAHALGAFQPLPALLALVGSVLIQIGTNLANDVYDHDRGADDAERLGPTRVTAAGLLRAGQVRRGMLLAFAGAVGVGGVLAMLAGWPVVAIGVASIASGFAYTGGPWPLGYHGLGDVFVLIFFGLVAVCGTVWVQTGQVPLLAWAAALPVGAIATAILVVNNVRDRETDARAHKRTLAVRFGRRFGVGQYALLLLGAQCVPVVLALEGRPAWVLLPLLTLPAAARLVRRLATTEGAALNRDLAGTARLLVAFGVLFSAGLALP